MYLALLSGADVTLLYVVPTIEDVIGGSPPIPIDVQWDFLSAKGHQYLAGVVQRSGWGTSKVRVAVETGNVAEVILTVATREQMDLIAIRRTVGPGLAAGCLAAWRKKWCTPHPRRCYSSGPLR